MNSISTGFRTSLYEFVFDPTWLDPVAGATVDSATGTSQVGSNTPVLRASSEPGRVKYTFFVYARLGLNPPSSHSPSRTRRMPKPSRRLDATVCRY